MFPISDLLFGVLSNLPGLITLDPDFKHNLKSKCPCRTSNVEGNIKSSLGFSTAIRSCSGIYVNGQSINTFLLEWYLVWIDGLDESAVQHLLHPDDPQDVPCAVELLTAVKNLGQIHI
jgi:hypothetical protein